MWLQAFECIWDFVCFCIGRGWIRYWAFKGLFTIGTMGIVWWWFKLQRMFVNMRGRDLGLAGLWLAMYPIFQGWVGWGWLNLHYCWLKVPQELSVSGCESPGAINFYYVLLMRLNFHNDTCAIPFVWCRACLVLYETSVTDWEFAEAPNMPVEHLGWLDESCAKSLFLQLPGFFPDRVYGLVLEFV